MASRRFYWLKLPEDFFRRGYIRRLRNREGGDRLVLIYLELLLSALKTEGLLPAEGDLSEELALELYEDETEVQTLLNYLSEYGKLTNETDAEYHLTDCDELIGSEADSAHRVRDYRRREKEKNRFDTADPAPSAVPSPVARPSFSDAEFAERMAALRRR